MSYFRLTCIRCHLQVCRTSEVVPSQRESPWTLCPSAARKHRLSGRLVDQRNAPPWGSRLKRPTERERDSKEFSNSKKEKDLSNERATVLYSSYPHC